MRGMRGGRRGGCMRGRGRGGPRSTEEYLKDGKRFDTEQLALKS